MRTISNPGPKNSIILLGMPGSGKTTLGKKLAEQYSLAFIDTDHLIQASEARSLQDILEQDGYLELRSVEERILLKLNLADSQRAIVSTGGSVVYSDVGMQRMQTLGYCVYLNVSIAALHKRVDNFSMRGIAAEKGSTLAELFLERDPLYRRYADIILDIENESIDRTIEKLVKVLPANLTG